MLTTELTDQELAKAYQGGASLAELASAVGHSPGWVRDRLLRNGVELRPPGGRPRDQRAVGNRPAPTPAEWAAQRVVDEANEVVEGIVAELPEGALGDLDAEVVADLQAGCVAVVIARREPAVAAAMARRAGVCVDDSMYSRASRKLARLAAKAAKAAANRAAQ